MKKILIVDDEKDVLISVRSFVESLGYKAKTSGSGKSALTTLKKEKFDLVLLDILMPNMSGKIVLEKIRDNPKLKNQKVAFLTVVRLDSEGKKFVKQLKPVDYINKPINTDDLKKRLKKILGE